MYHGTSNGRCDVGVTRTEGWPVPIHNGLFSRREKRQFRWLCRLFGARVGVIDILKSARLFLVPSSVKEGKTEKDFRLCIALLQTVLVSMVIEHDRITQIRASDLISSHLGGIIIHFISPILSGNCVEGPTGKTARPEIPVFQQRTRCTISSTAQAAGGDAVDSGLTFAQGLGPVKGIKISKWGFGDVRAFGHTGQGFSLQI